MNKAIKIGIIFIIVGLVLLVVGLIILGTVYPEARSSSINGYDYLQYYGVSYLLTNNTNSTLISGILLAIIIGPIILFCSMIVTVYLFLKNNYWKQESR